MKTVEDISGVEYSVAAINLVKDIHGCESVGQRIATIELPDGRTAEVQVLITTDEFEFIGD